MVSCGKVSSGTKEHKITVSIFSRCSALQGSLDRPPVLGRLVDEVVASSRDCSKHRIFDASAVAVDDVTNSIRSIDQTFRPEVHCLCVCRKFKIKTDVRNVTQTFS